MQLIMIKCVLLVLLVFSQILPTKGQNRKDQKIRALVFKAERYQHRADSIEKVLGTERNLSKLEKANLESQLKGTKELLNYSKEFLEIVVEEKNSYMHVARTMMKRSSKIISHGIVLDKNGDAIYINVEDTSSGNVIDVLKPGIGKFRHFKYQVDIYVEGETASKIDGYLILYNKNGYYTHYEEALEKKEALGNFSLYQLLRYVDLEKYKFGKKEDIKCAFVKKDDWKEEKVKNLEKYKAREIALIHNIEP